jgi:hypothetical protein
MAGIVLALRLAKQATNGCPRRQTIKQESTSPHDLFVKHFDSFPRAWHQALPSAALMVKFTRLTRAAIAPKMPL